jgi:hypothetical protein
MHSMNIKLNFIALNNSFTSHRAVLHFDSFFFKWRIHFPRLRQVRNMSLTGHFTLWSSKWMECRSRAIYLSNSSNRICRRHLNILAIFITEFNVTILTSRHLFFCLWLGIFSLIQLSILICTVATNKDYTLLNLYACSRLGKDFYISLESFDFGSESRLFRVPYILAPALVEEEVVISFFWRFHCRGLRKTRRQFSLNRVFYNYFHWLAYNWVFSVSFRCTY